MYKGSDMFGLKIKDIAGNIRNTAALAAVFFLLAAATGCCHGKNDCSPHGKNHYQQNSRQQTNQKSNRPARRRAKDYSRIPNNYPANWQYTTAGN